MYVEPSIRLIWFPRARIASPLDGLWSTAITGIYLFYLSTYQVDKVIGKVGR